MFGFHLPLSHERLSAFNVVGPAPLTISTERLRHIPSVLVVFVPLTVAANAPVLRATGANRKLVGKKKSNAGSVHHRSTVFGP